MFYKLIGRASLGLLLTSATYTSGESFAQTGDYRAVTFDECLVSGFSEQTVELGALTLGSGKNKPLNACVSIDGLQDSAGELQVEMGSTTDFEMHQIQKKSTLNRIELAVERIRDQGAIVRLTSQQPMESDQLDLVIKLLANDHYYYGQFSFPLLNEFQSGARLITGNLSKSPAVAFKKPEKSKLQAKPRLTIFSEVANLKEVEKDSAVNNSVSTVDNVDKKVPDNEPKATEANFPVVMSEIYKVKKGDSLSKIAVSLLPQYADSESLKTLTNKLVELNPKNFINNDMNLLRADLDLVLPEKQQVTTELLADIPAVKPVQAIDEEYAVYEVRKNDSLSVIAWKLKPQYPEFPTWHKLMTHLVELNPQAFIKGDINQLRADKPLRIPARVNTRVAQLSTDISHPR